ncbi:hypothetical protein DFH08DRAFT_805342 [Mycena albidolilacea]|uniref:Uncharacterized protein n=1 Tax=Mycena albidolilacea TaxID=1033008 RepID=A0AAD7A9E0_9AGAR|nr:hypothetical protein DFH08DRAFT_805342 [Mycena albidolilacea]
MALILFIYKHFWGMTAAVADASASRAQNKNATQALLQSAQNVLHQFQTQGVHITENADVSDLSRRQLRQVEERDATHALQTRLSGAATTDTGRDFFHVVMARNNNFAWKQLHLIWKRERIYAQNWSKGVRPPVLMKRGKSISVLTKPELKLLNAALDARDEPGQGLRFMRRAEDDDGDMVLFSHDYSLPSPSGPPDAPAVHKFWRSSLTEPVLCMDADGVVWKTQYDLDLPNNGVAGQAAPRKGQDKAGKGKKRVVEDEDDYEAEVESEEETHPAPATQKRKVDDGEPAPNKRRKASSAPSAPPPAPSVPPSAPSRKKSSAAASSHGKRKAQPVALETIGEHPAPSPRLSPAPAPSRRKRKTGALESVDECVEPAQEGGGRAKPMEGLCYDLEAQSWVPISHGRPPATSSGCIRAVVCAGVHPVPTPSRGRVRRSLMTGARPAPSPQTSATGRHIRAGDFKTDTVARDCPSPPCCHYSSDDTLVHGRFVRCRRFVCCRRFVRRRLAATSSSAATTSSAALQRGGTIYGLHDPQPIGEWFSGADNKNGVVGMLHVAPSDVPQRQGAAPQRAKAAKAPTTAASSAQPKRKPKVAPSNILFGPPGPLLTSSAGAPNPAAPNIAVAPAPTPVVAPAVVPAVPTPAHPPLDAAALVGLWAQLNQVFGGRDPTQVIAEMQGPPPPQ